MVNITDKTGPKAYAGIGSRETPPEWLDVMTLIARRLDAAGWVLRSGGARGADQAFAAGSSRKQVFTSRFPLHPAARASVALFHPAPYRLSVFARILHARNAHILFGAGMDDPVTFVVCWTPWGSGSGGTGQALRIAHACGIPVFDLGLEAHGTAFRQALGL